MKLNSLFEKVFETHWNTPRFQGSRRAKEVRLLYESKIKEAFGNIDVSKITPTMVRAWHHNLALTPAHATKALSVFRSIYREALYSGFIECSNPCDYIREYATKKRGIYAGPETLQKLWVEFEKEKVKKPHVITFLLCVLYTGSRPQAIQKMSWNDITVSDNGLGLLSFDGKGTAESGEKEKLYIPMHIMKLLTELPERDDCLVFGKIHYTRIWNKIRKNIGFPQLWARDLRRSFATAAMSDGIGKDIVGQLLNHKDPATTDRYAKLYDGKRVEAVNQISDKLTQMMGKKND
jgi:integrase